MEASLLPSPEIRALCGKVTVAASRIEDPASKALTGEFEIPYGNCWILVLDGKGETLASFMADHAGQGCTKESAGKFPAMIAAKIEACLKRTESLQALEQRWRADPKDLPALQDFAARLEESDAHRRLTAFCDEALARPDLIPPVRDEVRMRAFLGRSKTGDNITSGEARERFVEEGIRLLLDAPTHPKAAEALNWLCWSGLANAFDLPAKSQTVLDQLRTEAETSGDGARAKALDAHIQTLSDLCSKRIAQTEENLKKLPETNRQGRGLGAATLGDAEGTLRFLDGPPDPSWNKAMLALAAQLVSEAKEKLARARTAP